MGGKTKQLSGLIPSRRLDPDRLLDVEAGDKSFLSYVKELDHRAEVSIDLPWSHILEAFGWKINPPEEILKLAPIILGTKRSPVDSYRRRQLPFLIIAQKLTWSMPYWLLQQVGRTDLSQRLAYHPELIDQVAIDFGAETPPDDDYLLPESWMKFIIARDSCYVRAGQNNLPLSEQLDRIDQFQRSIFYYGQTNGLIDEQQLLIQAEELGRPLVFSSLEQAAYSRQEDLQLPYPQDIILPADQG